MRNFLLWILASLVLSLAACGGGGGGGSETAAAPASPTAPPAALPNVNAPAVSNGVVAALNPAVPAATRALVAQVVSPQGFVSPGGTLPAEAGMQGALMLAIDADSNILLASSGAPPAEGMGARSTALVLVRLALGDLGGKVAASELETAIQNTAAFSSLVTLVDAQLARQSPPALSPQVLTGVQETVNQVLAAVATKLKLPTALLGGLAQTRVESPYPYALKKPPAGFGLGSMAVSIDASRFLRNSMPIAWTAWTEDLDGRELLPPGETTGHVILPEGGLLSQFVGAGSSTPLPSDNGRNDLNLVIGQSSLSRKQNFLAITKGVLNFALEGTPCVSELAQEVMKAPELAAALEAPSMDTAMDYLRKFRADEVKWAVIKGCVLSRLGTEQTIHTIAGYLMNLTPMQVYDGFSLGAQIRLTHRFWKEPDARFGLCQNRLGIVDCAIRIEMSPQRVTYAPGLFVDPVTDDRVAVTGRNAKGYDTLLKLDRLTWTSSNTQSVDYNFGLLVTKAPGLATVQAVDPSTGAKGSYVIQVANPALSSSVLRLNVEAGSVSGSLTLVAAGTGETLRVPPDTTWTSSNDAVAIVFPAGTQGGASRLVMAKAGGEARITASSASGRFSLTAQVIVGKEATTTTVTASPSPSKVGQRVTLAAQVGQAPGATVAGPSGNVSFVDQNGSILCLAPLAQGAAQCDTTFGLDGVVVIQATYPGDSSHAGSTSVGLQHTVNAVVYRAALQPPTATVAIGGTTQLAAVLYADDVAQSNVGWRWTTSNEAVATVNDSGLVTGHVPGVAQITALHAESGAQAQGMVTVDKPELAGTFVINPQGTYAPNLIARYDNTRQATVLRFSDYRNAAPGTRISLEISGRYVAYGADPDAGTAVFVGSRGYIAAEGVTPFNTYCCGWSNYSPNYQSTDLPQDFLIPRGQTLIVTIPAGADYILFGTPSIYFSANQQGSPPFSVTVKALP
jgi:uncharacterized protein YjdB